MRAEPVPPPPARAPNLADALAAASTDPASCSRSCTASMPAQPAYEASRSRHRSTRRGYAAPWLLLALLLLLARPANALFDPGEPLAPSSASPSVAASSSVPGSSSPSSGERAPKLASSPLSAKPAPAASSSAAGGAGPANALAPLGARSMLPPGCRRTTSLLRDICPAPHNAALGVHGASSSAAALRSELVLCPLPEVQPLAPGAAEGEGRRETTWAVSGTVTLVEDAPGELLQSASFSASSNEAPEPEQQRITATDAHKGAEEQWPEEGADGYWRHVDGVAHWVPAAQSGASAGREGDMSPVGDAPASVKPAASSAAASAVAAPQASAEPSPPASLPAEKEREEGDAARAAYSAWSASVGGEGSDTWLSFAQWRAAHEEALREAAAAKGKKEERKRGAAAAAKRKEEGNGNAQGQGAETKGEGGESFETESVTRVQEAEASFTPSARSAGAPIPASSAPSPPASASVSPKPSASPSALEPNSIPAIGNPASQLATLKHRWNFASLDCAAVVHRSNPSAKFASAVLSEKKDRYMLSPCPASSPAGNGGRGGRGGGEGQFIIVELCDEISIDTIVLANYEFFSRMFKRFRVRVARKLQEREEDWVDIGTFRARNVRGLQVFNTPPPKSDARFFRYVRLDFLEHYGSEYYCPVSLLRVYGLTQMDDYIREEEELKREREREAAGLLIEAEVSEEDGAEYEDGTAREGKSWNEKDAEEGVEDRWKEWDEKLRHKLPAEAEGNETDAFVPESEAEAMPSAETAEAAVPLNASATEQATPVSPPQAPPSSASDTLPSASDNGTGYAEITGAAEMRLGREMPPPSGLLNATRFEAAAADGASSVASAPAEQRAQSSSDAPAPAQGGASQLGSDASAPASSDATSSEATQPIAHSSPPSLATAAQSDAAQLAPSASASNGTRPAAEAARNATAPLATADSASRNVSAVASPSAAPDSSSAAADASGSSAAVPAGAAGSAKAHVNAATAAGAASGAQGTAGTPRSAATASSSSGSGSASPLSGSAASSSVASPSASQPGSPPPPPAPEVPAGRTSSGTSGHSGSSGAGSGSGSGGGSESIYRTITKRLNALEANATLSLQYIEHSGQMLREVFARMERKQEERMGEMLRALNASNWRQIDGLKRRQQVDLQQAIFEFDVHRQRTDAERNRLVAELHVLANEVLLEKRFGIAQLILLLGLFIFMALTRGSRAAPLIHSGLARISGTPRQGRPGAVRSGTTTSGTDGRRVSEDNKGLASGKRPTHGRSESSASVVPRSSNAQESSKSRKSSLGLGRGLAPLREPLRSVQAGSDRFPRSTPANFERSVRRPSVNRSARPAALASTALRAATTGSLSGAPATARAGPRTAPLRLKVPVPSSSDFAEMSQEELRSWLGFLTPIHADDTAPSARHHQADEGAQRESTRGRDARMARSETITKLAQHVAAHEAGEPSSAPARVVSTTREAGVVAGDESLSSDWGTERSEDDEDSTAESGFESESIQLEPAAFGQLNGTSPHLARAEAHSATSSLKEELEMQRSATISPPRTLKALNAASSSATAAHAQGRSSPHLATVFPPSPRTPADLESDADDDESASGAAAHTHRWASSSSRPRRAGSHRERRHTARPGSAGSMLGTQTCSASPAPFGAVAANAGKDGGLLAMPHGLSIGFGNDATPQRVASPLARRTSEPREVELVAEPVEMTKATGEEKDA